jgi:hypothetical protein
MELAHRWASRNLSRLELVAAILVLALLVGTFLGRGLRVFAAAEERSLQATVLNMNSALRIQFYELVIAGRAADAAAWQGANPVRLLEGFGGTMETGTVIEHPELARFHAVAAGLGTHYLGEFEFPGPASVEGGQWYFDLSEAVLVYRVRNREFFRSQLPGAPRVRFRLDLQFDDLNGDGQYNPESEIPADVAIRTVDEYQWIEAGPNS